jgi:hypothetical protein
MKAYTVYTAIFKDGYQMTATSKEYSNRLDFYNEICRRQLGRIHGSLKEINCRPMPA